MIGKGASTPGAPVHSKAALGKKAPLEAGPRPPFSGASFAKKTISFSTAPSCWTLAGWSAPFAMAGVVADMVGLGSAFEGSIIPADHPELVASGTAFSLDPSSDYQSCCSCHVGKGSYQVSLGTDTCVRAWVAVDFIDWCWWLSSALAAMF